VGESYASTSELFSRASAGDADLLPRPDCLPVRPALRTVVKADVLSDVLRAVRLTGAVYFDLELSSPWITAAPLSRDIAGKVMPGAQRVIEFHLIARGTC